jgi:glucose/arabinose dehydrogenase
VRGFGFFFSGLGWLLLLSASRGDAQGFEVLRVANGLQRPVYLTAPPGDAERVFILEAHLGEILILRRDSWTIDATPFLTVSGLSTAGEQGLLGLAFHPDYETNGFFYVYFTDAASNSRVVRYSVSTDSDIADPDSDRQVLSFSQPQANHNGGWIGFGPDGYLYIASGDGGAGNDSGSGHTAEIGNAQDITGNRLGKLLRVDVDGDDFPSDPSENYAVPPGNPFVGVAGDDEIWAYGLRNPWRASFDRLTGDLYIADVGQGACEELNVQLAASPGGENYGWRPREGVIATPKAGVGGPRPPGAIEPFFDYPHSEPGCSEPAAGFSGKSVTGGYVYRGPVLELRGRYFFGDFIRGRLWSVLWDGTDPANLDGSNYSDLRDHGDVPAFDPNLGTIDFISSFGEDDDGNLYVLDLEGEVFLLPGPSTAASGVASLGTLLALACLRAIRASRTAQGAG